MTLKEIYKIIDEADVFFVNTGDKKSVLSIDAEYTKNSVKTCIENDVKKGHMFIFYKLNDKGEVEKSWRVDHIDKEKKEKKEKKRKYKKGDQIKTIEEFDEVIKNNGVLFLHNVAKHTSFLQNLQYHYIKLEIARGNMYKAIKKTEDDNRKEVN